MIQQGNARLQAWKLFQCPGYTDVRIGENYFTTIKKIGDSIVYMQSRGSLKNYDLGKINDLAANFCKDAGVTKPYVQIRDLSQIHGRLPFSIMKKQMHFFYDNQSVLKGVVMIKQPSWIQPFVSHGLKLFNNAAFDYVSASDYSEAIKAALKILNSINHKTDDRSGKTDKISFDDVVFNPEWKYSNSESGFRSTIGIVPDKVVYIALSGKLDSINDIDKQFQLSAKVIRECNLTGIPFFILNYTDVAALKSMLLRRHFAREVKKQMAETDNLDALNIVINPDRLNRIAIRLLAPFVNQKTVIVDSLEEAFDLTGENSGTADIYASVRDIFVSAAHIEEISNLFEVLQWNEIDNVPEARVSFDNPLAYLAESLELVKSDLHEVKENERRLQEERLWESEENQKMLLNMMQELRAAKEDLEKEQESRRILLDNIHTQVWYLTDPVTYGTVNKAHADFNGVAVEDMAYKRLYELFPKEDAEFYEISNIKVFTTGQVVYLEEWSPHHSGERRLLSIVKTPKLRANGTVEYVVCTAEDITERKLAEDTKQQLEIANKTARFKQNFLANMSHEIRTPLTGVMGMTDVLGRTSLSAEQKDYVETLKTSGKHLKEIIDQVLDFSKIEAGKVQLHPMVFRFSFLTADVEMLYKSNVAEGVEFLSENDPRIPPFIEADKNRLTQVLNNLVANALKFTRRGKVEIRTKLFDKNPVNRELTIKVEVSDTGIGIPPEKQDQLFIPFSQVEQIDTREFDGTGLGLSICKELIDLMGGQIGVNSEPGKGSTFWFTFPAREAEELDIKKVDKPQQKSRGVYRILLVEDKAINQKVVSLMLHSLGHSVEIAGNGQQAIEFFQPGRYDLILMDIQMPVMDGVTATRLLKDKYDNLPPIVGLSANAFEGDRQKYMDRGMDEYLTKPVKREDFERLMFQLFEREEE